MNSSSNARYVAYGGMATALSTVSMLLSGLLPILFNVLPLVVCPVCFYIAIRRANWVTGIICMIATGFLTFFILGFQPLLILEYLMFTVPHSILIQFITKLKYDMVTGPIRVALIGGLSLLGSTVGVTFFFDMLGYGDFFGLAGFKLYVAIYAINAVTLILADFMYTRLAFILYPRFFKLDMVQKPTTGKVDAEDIFE